MTDQELVQSQLAALHQQQEALLRLPRIKKYLDVVGKHVNETQGRDMTIFEKRNLAQVLYNAVIDTGLKAGTRLFEATTEDNIAFLGIQLPVIAALLPSEKMAA
jgi:predicted TIM-barrel enzyme